jgi:hypothetical protein
MRRPVGTFLLVATLGVALAGCGGPHATPESTFQTYQNAVASRDWKTSLACLTPEGQDKLVAGLVMMVAAASTVNQDAAALLEKHGVGREEMMMKMMAGALGKPGKPGEAITEGMKQSLAAIPDKPAFVADAMRWLEETNQQVASGLTKAAEAELIEVAIDGDTATGKLSLAATGTQTPIRFRRIDGRWLIDL